MLKWFQNYLSYRTQSVTFQKESSQELNIRYGVPQGSVLGPLLFLLYVNDLARVSNKLTPIMFADDSNFFLHGIDLEVMETLINHELKDIIRWLYANRLSLNSCYLT